MLWFSDINITKLIFEMTLKMKNPSCGYDFVLNVSVCDDCNKQYY